MNLTNRQPPSRRLLIDAAAVLVVAGIGAGAFLFETWFDRSELEEAALTRARAHARDVVLTRHWNAGYGGVYVEKRAGVEASPELAAHDIAASNGKTYTLRSPELMTRELADMAAQGGDYRFRVTGLAAKPPQAPPDDWELAALRALATGRREYFGEVASGERTEFRYMVPVRIEQACRDCAMTPIQEGGVSISFDISELVAGSQRSRLPLALAMMLTLGGVFLLGQVFTRRLDRRLQRLRHSHDELVESIDGIVWEADAGSRQFAFVSRQAERLLGYPLGDWQQPDFWAEHLHPDDKAAAVARRTACAESGRRQDFEYRLLARDGREVWLHESVTALAETGQPTLLRGLLLDITAHKRQEEEVRRLLLEKESILQSALVGLVYVRQRRIVSCNRRFEEIFGYRPGELNGQSTQRLYATEADYLAVGERAQRALEQGTNHTQEVQLRRQDGHVFWGALNGRAADPARPQDGSIWVYADISKRREAEAQVRKLSQAVEQSPVSIVITDRAGTIEYVNPRFCRATGYTAAEAIGQNPRLLKTGETPPETYAELWQTILAGHDWRGVLRNRRKDGELFWEEVSISPIVNEAGEITHFLAVKEDISERKRAEDALRDSQDAYLSLLATTLDGFWLLDPRGRLLDANASYIRQSGYSRQELLAMCFTDLEAAEAASTEAPAERLRQVIAHGSAQFETVHRRKDGSEWPVEVSVTYRAAGGGQFFVFVRDISARKRIQQELEDHQANLEQIVARRTADLAEALAAAKVADQAKDAFLANVSHELRTPLNAVIGLSGLARKASSDPRQREYLEKINDAGQTLLGVINDLLDLTKIAAGEMHFEAVPFKLRRVAARVHSVMTHRAGEKGLHLESEIDPAVPEVLVGDPLRVEQILINLINNAIKFTERGRVTVRIRVLAKEDARVRLRIDVEDTGIGMQPADIERLFKPFAQADASITRKYGGTGLGLAICKRLAEGMDGNIEVSSRPGQGTCFTVTFWLGVGQPGAEPEDDEADEGKDLPSRYADAKVLLADDQPLNQEVVVELLATVGIVPRVVGNGREALDVLFAAGPGAYDMVLMDIQMPIMDGLTATREIRARPGFAELPIVAMTAHTMEHEKAGYLADGMNDHIGKPFKLTSFFRLLAKWLAHRAGRDAPAPAAAATPATPATTPPSVSASTPTSAPASAAAPTPAVAGPLPAIVGLDTGPALERFAGNAGRYRHWLSVFIDESAGFTAQIEAAIADGRTDEARKTAHAFKGRVGMLGMSELHPLAAELEQRIAQGEPCQPLIDGLALAIENMRARLRQALGVETTA